MVLIGHSYGGMVATGVADRARARVAQLVYLDAFAPTDGQAVFDLVPPDVAEKMRAGAAASPSSYGVPSNPMPSDTSPEDVGMGNAAAHAAAAQGVLHAAEAVRRALGAAQLHLCTKIGLTTRSASSRRARNARTGAISRSTRATTRTSPRRRRCSRSSTRSPAHDDRAADRHRGARPARRALGARLVGAGFTPKGYDIDAAKVAAFAQAGGIAAPLDQVAHCDVVLLAVFDTAQVEDVVENAVLPAQSPAGSKVVLFASTCDPDRIAALTGEVAPHGLS